MACRSVAFVLLLMCAVTVAEPVADGTNRPLFVRGRMFTADKGHHLAVSAAIYAVSFYALRQEMNASQPTAVQASVGIALSFGIGKEVYDRFSPHGSVSWRDLLADLAGVALAAALFSLPIK